MSATLAGIKGVNWGRHPNKNATSNEVNYFQLNTINIDWLYRATARRYRVIRIIWNWWRKFASLVSITFVSLSFFYKQTIPLIRFRVNNGQQGERRERKRFKVHMGDHLPARKEYHVDDEGSFVWRGSFPCSHGPPEFRGSTTMGRSFSSE